MKHSVFLRLGIKHCHCIHDNRLVKPNYAFGQVCTMLCMIDITENSIPHTVLTFVASESNRMSLAHTVTIRRYTVNCLTAVQTAATPRAARSC